MRTTLTRKIQICRLGETLRYNNYEITFSEQQWGNGSLIGDAFPCFVFAGIREGPEDARAGRIILTIRKNSERAECFELTGISFSSGEWGNQFDLELFYMLNPALNSLALDLKAGEEQSVILPPPCSESNFPKKNGK